MTTASGDKNMTLSVLHRRAVLRIAGATAAGLGLPARAQTFPAKPIRIVVPFAPGGPTDLMARAIGKSLSQSLGQPVVVDNKPGGGGVIGLGEVAKSPADGYTLVFPSILAVTNPALMPNYPFDTARDFGARHRGGLHRTRAGGAARLSRQDAGRTGGPGQGQARYPGLRLFRQRHFGPSGGRDAGRARRHPSDPRALPWRRSGGAGSAGRPGAADVSGHHLGAVADQGRQAARPGYCTRAPHLGAARGSADRPSRATPASTSTPGTACWCAAARRRRWCSGSTRKPAARSRRPEVRELFAAQGIEPGGMPPAEFGTLIRDDLAGWKRTVERLNIKLE